MKFKEIFNEGNFTFKTIKPTGKYRSFYKFYHYIKLNKKEVGYFEENDNGKFKIRLKIYKSEKDKINDKNPNCKWKWITFKNEFNSLEEAKEWLKIGKEYIVKNFDLCMDD